MGMTVAEILQRWDRDGHCPIKHVSFDRIHQLLEFFERKHYRQYLPTSGPDHPGFFERLKCWMSQVNDEANQREMIEMLSLISFFGHDEFASLFHAAYRGPITRWVIDELGVSFDDATALESVQSALEHHTWFIGLTDSAKINEFHNANGVGGIDLRPDCRSLVEFANWQRVLDFMQGHLDASRIPRPLNRIVVLEDFVGSGTQMDQYVTELARNLPNVSVLFSPLIICPSGAELARNSAQNITNLSYAPVIELSKSDLINRDTVTAPGSLIDKVKALAQSTFAEVKGTDPQKAGLAYNAFGFPAPPNPGTGALVVMYSNTPANTFPMIHHRSNTWLPLFPRSARIR